MNSVPNNVIKHSENMPGSNVHLGRNIKRIREIQGLKQEALVLELGGDWNQKKVSLLESKETIDNALLAKVAKALRTTPEAIKHFDEGRTISQIQNPVAVANGSGCYPPCPLDLLQKWLAALEEHKQLYERLLHSEREKVELLEKVLGLKK